MCKEKSGEVSRDDYVARMLLLQRLDADGRVDPAKRDRITERLMKQAGLWGKKKDQGQAGLTA